MYKERTEIAMADETNYGVLISDFLEKTNIEDTDILIVEDSENTKQVKFRALRQSLISDTESPASYRIYSSQKVKKLMDEVEESYVSNIGSMKDSINNLEKQTVTTNDLNSAVSKLDEAKLDKTVMTSILEEFDNTRKTTDLITGNDLAYASEEDKIHLKHLGSDVLDAMTGSTPVTTPSVPKGGWVSEDLANGSITALKLSKDYNYRGSYPQGDLNKLVESGYYEVGAESTALPHYGDDYDETRLLEVIRYGVDSKYIVQRVYYKENNGESRPYYERKGVFSRLSALEFIPHFDITSENKVGSDILGDDFNNRGVVTSGSVYDLSAAGNYLCESTVKDLPTADKYMVNVRKFDSRIEYEAKLATTSGCFTYVSYQYKDSNQSLQTTDWFNTTDASKSKFDGKSIHLFGDGYSTGEGASNITGTSYNALLTSKYGYKIYNHALSGATAGNYDDELFAERSLITQIDTATGLTSDMYAIIFIGSEDWRSGMAPIGNKTNSTDTSFMGSLNIAIKKLCEKAPQCKILLVTPFYRASTEPSDGYDSDTSFVNDKYLSDFSDAMVEIGKFNHIPCLNLMDTCSINKYNWTQYLSSNGVELNDTGHALICDKIHDAMCMYY
jgi:lysophospholipase L1-like esterase